MRRQAYSINKVGTFKHHTRVQYVYNYSSSLFLEVFVLRDVYQRRTCLHFRCESTRLLVRAVAVLDCRDDRCARLISLYNRFTPDKYHCYVKNVRVGSRV